MRSKYGQGPEFLIRKFFQMESEVSHSALSGELTWLFTRKSILALVFVENFSVFNQEVLNKGGGHGCLDSSKIFEGFQERL